MKMKSTSAAALAWFSGILMVLGWLVMSPSGAVFCFVISAICAAFPALFATTKARFAAIVLLIIAIFSAVGRYPDYKRERERLRSGSETACIQVFERN